MHEKFQSRSATTHGEVWMRSRQGLIRLLSVLALMAGLALMTAAYAVSANRPQSPVAHTKSVGTFRAVIDTIDYLDTSQAYTAQSLWALWTGYETLVTYRHVAGAAGYQVVPGLASLPKISRGGKVYTLTLRKGLKYSNGKPIRAADFKCTVKRDFLTASPGVGFYDTIVGAKKFETSLKGDIGGIKTKGRTIRITLTSPRGDFLTILAEPFAALVPCGTANQDLSANPPPASGPYKIGPNPDNNRGFSLVRNKYFKPTKYIPRGTPNRADVTIVRDADAAAQRVITGQAESTTLYASYLSAIGLKTTLKFLPRSTYYTTIGNSDTKAQTGWARWLEDYPHPLDWFDVLLNGRNIVHENNNNFAYYSNAKTNRLIDGLKKPPALTPAVNKRWANVEKLIMQQAPWAPWSNRTFPEFFSKNMGCISIQRLYGIDFMKVCRK